MADTCTKRRGLQTHLPWVSAGSMTSSTTASATTDGPSNMTNSDVGCRYGRAISGARKPIAASSSPTLPRISGRFTKMLRKGSAASFHPGAALGSSLNAIVAEYTLAVGGPDFQPPSSGRSHRTLAAAIGCLISVMAVGRSRFRADLSGPTELDPTHLGSLSEEVRRLGTWDIQCMVPQSGRTLKCSLVSYGFTIRVSRPSL